MEATIPRSLPVMTGLPLSFGSRACSQDAKNASPSMWTIARGKPWMESGVSGIVRRLVFSDDGFYDRGDTQVLFGGNGVVLLVAGFQRDLASPLSEVLYRPGAVYLGDDNIAILGLASAFNEHLIARHDARLDHGVAGDFEDVGCLFVADEVIVERHGVDELFLRGGRPASLHYPEYAKGRVQFLGNEATGCILCDDAQFDELCDELMDSVLGLESQKCCDLGIGRHASVSPVELEDLRFVCFEGRHGLFR